MSIETTLVVILHCDIVGSTVLVTKDERLAHQRMQDLFCRLSDVIESFGGVTSELRGDALLAKFERASDCVNAALSFQNANRAFNKNLHDDIKPEARIGIALGEVVISDSTLTGAGVVLAQRLEQLADSGGVVIQGAVREALPERLPIQFNFLGEQELKGFENSVRAFSVSDRDHIATDTDDKDIGLVDQGPVLYCSSTDGASIAYTEVGSGVPILAVGSWMSHLEQDWENPLWAHYLRFLAKDYRLIRYDQRGNGMSDWDVPMSFDLMVDDLSAVMDRIDDKKVTLFGPSQAASVSIAFAIKHPEKVAGLILYGAYSRGRCKRGNLEEQQESDALITFFKQNWGNDNPVARQMMTSMLMPDATQQQAVWFNQFQKACAPADNIAQLRKLYDNIDVSGLLPDIEIPTLVIHCTGDVIAPLSEGKLIASRIPGARLVTLDSNSHLVFEHESGFSRFIETVNGFMQSNR